MTAANTGLHAPDPIEAAAVAHEYVWWAKRERMCAADILLMMGWAGQGWAGQGWAAVEAAVAQWWLARGGMASPQGNGLSAAERKLFCDGLQELGCDV